MHNPDELKALAEEALERLELWPELHGQSDSVRYSLEVGGKRVRPVITLAVGEALGAGVDQVMPAALAIELVHTFSLVHDDLPGMDNDAELPEAEQAPWRAFADELGLLFQIVDDILDADGYVREHGTEAARRYADEAAERARARLDEVAADTSVLREIVDSLAVRTA